MKQAQNEHLVINCQHYPEIEDKKAEHLLMGFKPATLHSTQWLLASFFQFPCTGTVTE